MALLKVNFNPTPRALRLFGAMAIAFIALVTYRVSQHEGGLHFWHTAWMIPVVLPGFLFLRWMKLLYLGACFVTRPLGFIGSHVLMALSFFVVFTGIGALIRLLGKDPLRRKRAEGSYWQAREGSRPLKSYFKQY